MNFKEYVSRFKPNRKHLCSEVGISLQLLRYLLEGKSIPSVGVAHRIERATNGAITLDSWIEVEREMYREGKIKKDPPPLL